MEETAVTTGLTIDVTTHSVSGTLLVSVLLFMVVPATGSELFLVVRFQFKSGALAGLKE